MHNMMCITKNAGPSAEAWVPFSLPQANTCIILQQHPCQAPLSPHPKPRKKKTALPPALGCLTISERSSERHASVATIRAFSLEALLSSVPNMESCGRVG
jgi:hypothetical protein